MANNIGDLGKFDDLQIIKMKQIMKRRILTILMGAMIGMIGFQSCEKEENENETKISSYDSTKSHNTGENCMNCHRSGGSGEGWFTTAGSVYDSTKTSTFPNATIRLYTSPNGQGNLMATIQVDKYGNFYTTEYLDFGNKLYASAEGSSITKYMNSALASGQCNSCHGITTDRIWTK